MKQSSFFIIIVIAGLAVVGVADSFAGSPNSLEEEVQIRLNSLGLNAGPVDGVFGVGTIRALEGFQKENSLPVTGKADVRSLMLLFPVNSRSNVITDAIAQTYLNSSLTYIRKLSLESWNKKLGGSISKETPLRVVMGASGGPGTISHDDGYDLEFTAHSGEKINVQFSQGEVQVNTENNDTMVSNESIALFNGIAYVFVFEDGEPFAEHLKGTWKRVKAD